jgi:predicted MFS family arabinose efflux permease
MQVAFAALAAVGLVSFLMVWLTMPETRPARNAD